MKVTGVISPTAGRVRCSVDASSPGHFLPHGAKLGSSTWAMTEPSTDLLRSAGSGCTADELQRLLAQRADIHAETDRGQSPLQLAAKAGEHGLDRSLQNYEHDS